MAEPVDAARGPAARPATPRWLVVVVAVLAGLFVVALVRRVRCRATVIHFERYGDSHCDAHGRCRGDADDASRARRRRDRAGRRRSAPVDGAARRRVPRPVRIALGRDVHRSGLRRAARGPAHFAGLAQYRPGEAAITAQLNLACTAPSVLDFAAAGAYPDVQWQASYPVSEAQWAAGQREYSCFISRSSAEPLTGSVQVPPAA
jgi:hypothetical protein